MINILLLQNLKSYGRNVDLRLKQANLASKNDIANFVNKTDFDNQLLSFNKSINSNKTKRVLVEMNSKNYRHLINIPTDSQNYCNIFWSSRYYLRMGI